MSKETSAEMATLAARRLDDPDPEVRSLAACVLSQREPDTAHRMRVALVSIREKMRDKTRTVYRSDLLPLIEEGLGEI